MSEDVAAVLADREDPPPEQWPWWMSFVVGLFVIGFGAALLGVRTCL